MLKTNLIIYSLLLIVPLSGCIYEKMNQRLVERLNSQIKSEEYGNIYSESSNSAKDYKYSREEFIERLKEVRAKMKEVDESLQFQKLQGICGDEGVYRADNFACRYIEKNGRRIDIDIWLDANGGLLRLLDLCIHSDEMDGRLCVSDVSRS
jgi:uncharacterized protein YxeA